VGRDRCCAYGGDRLFGQNVPYPGFGTAGGFIASALIIIILASVLFIIFKRKGWL
jgi:magnesium transporter